MIPLCLPFALAISFLLSSALVDVSLVFPELAGVWCWLPASMFLRVCNADTAALAALLAAAVLCGAACGILHRNLPKASAE